VLEGLRALENAYGSTTNAKGYRVINGAGIIQGDGIDRHNVRTILKAVMDAGYSAENVAFGMGAGLLQKVNRDTLGYAMKLSYVEQLDGRERHIMKLPKTDMRKASLPGLFHVQRDWFDKETGVHVPRVYPAETTAAHTGPNLLETVWDCGPVGYEFDSFDEVRNRVDTEWNGLPPSLAGGAISDPMTTKRNKIADQIRATPV
jgi:nicotinamide phosphoribosyltransferase